MELKDNVRAFIDACGGHNVAIIVDESHKMKNLQSQQTLAINAIKRSLTFRANKVYTYLLTGTPFTTGYIDLYSQLKTLGYPETKSSFVDRFCIRGHVPGLLGWQQPIIGYTNIDELFNIIHEYAITVKSESVVDLPEKIFVEHVLPESEDEGSPSLLGMAVFSGVDDSPLDAITLVGEASKDDAERLPPLLRWGF